MFDTVSITELQKSPRQTLKKTKGYCYILSNNKKTGLITDEKMMIFLEERGILEEYEDWILTFSPEFNDEKEEGRRILETGDFSKTISFDEL